MEVEKPSFLQGLHRVSRTDGRPCKTTRNNRRVFRMPRRSIKDASVARLDNLKTNSAQTKPRGKSKEGGRSPLLGRFKGVCQGGESNLPLDWFPFHRQRPFPLTSKEKGAEYRPNGSIPFPPHIFLAYTSRSWYDGACKPFHTILTRTAGRLKGGFYDLSDHFGQHLRPQP